MDEMYGYGGVLDLVAMFEEKIENLKKDENPRDSGFMRERYPVNWAASNSLSIPPCYPGMACDMKKSIKDAMSASDYDTLMFTTYLSPKETIENYVQILEQLLAQGIFDPPQLPQSPLYVNPMNPNTTPTPVTDPKKECNCGGDCCDCKNGCSNESKDNSGKPYDGPVLEIHFSGGTEIQVQNVSNVFHNMMFGTKDYINSNVVVSNDGETSTLTVCVNDCENVGDVFDRLMTIMGMLKQLIREVNLGEVNEVSDK